MVARQWVVVLLAAVGVGVGEAVAGNRTFRPLALKQRAATVDTRAGSAYTPPNIIMMIADDIGFTDMGYFGYDLSGTTPIMDQLAGEGIKFSNW